MASCSSEIRSTKYGHHRNRWRRYGGGKIGRMRVHIRDADPGRTIDVLFVDFMRWAWNQRDALRRRRAGSSGRGRPLGLNHNVAVKVPQERFGRFGDGSSVPAPEQTRQETRGG